MRHRLLHLPTPAPRLAVLVRLSHGSGPHENDTTGRVIPRRLLDALYNPNPTDR